MGVDLCVMQLLEKRIKNKRVNKLIFMIGFVLSCYPVVSHKIVQKQQISLISSYQDYIKKEDKKVLDEMRKKAQEYNRILYNRQKRIQAGVEESATEQYEGLLKITDTGMMSSIEIPKIDLRLPIYHGTSDEVLAQGAGHLKGTSLPVGGKDTHCVITGHRGLPRAKLFVRLDELKTGDIFFIETGGNKMVYEVKKIKVIEPQEVETLGIKSGQDMVSLVTCTPYGINTHRLVVTGERVERKKEYNRIKTKVPSFRECAFDILPFFFLTIASVLIFAEGRRKVHEKKKY